jgi:hypothetical protein
MVRVETDERIKRINAGRTISNDIGRLKGFVDASTEASPYSQKRII